MLSSLNSSILGFSITGTSIPIGSGVLVQVSFSDYFGEGICFGVDPIDNVISNIYGKVKHLKELILVKKILLDLE